MCVQIVELSENCHCVILSICARIGECWTTIIEHLQKISLFERKIFEMRKCLPKFSRIFECGAVLLEQRARVHPLFATSPGLAAAV